MASGSGICADEVNNQLEGSTLFGENPTYLPPQIVVDRNTEMYVKSSKVMIIFQGPYTPGRFEALDSLRKKFKDASCFPSYELYMNSLRNIYDSQFTEEFCEYFQSEFQKTLEKGHNVLVMDATMSNLNQNRNYMALAHQMQYIIHVIPPIIPKRAEDSLLLKNLPIPYSHIDAILGPENKFEHRFCAWFLNEVDSYELRKEAGLCIDECIQNLPKFNQLFSKVCIIDRHINYVETRKLLQEIIPDDQLPDVVLIEDFISYFNLHNKIQDIAYCVTKVFCSMRSMSEYFKKESVIKNYGKVSKLFIAGYIVSPYMVAARVKLSHCQKEVWEAKDEINEDEPINMTLCPSDLFQNAKHQLPYIDVDLKTSDSRKTLHNTGQTIRKPIDIIHRFTKGKSCHIVLGKAPNAPAHHIDFDVAYALRRESNAIRYKSALEIEELGGCVAMRIGKYWYIYLREMLCVDGFFTSCVNPFTYKI